MSVQVSKVIDIHGERRTEFALFDCVLPSAPAVQASFSPEGLGAKVAKIFKKEIQVGDETFDDAVYVSTDTPDATAAFLKSERMQNTILMCAGTGGFIEIEGRRLTAKIPSSTTDEDPSLVELVQVLLGIA